jgi:hypothetical protein
MVANIGGFSREGRHRSIRVSLASEHRTSFSVRPNRFGALRSRCASGLKSEKGAGEGALVFAFPLQSRCKRLGEMWSGRLDSNQRPPDPQSPDDHGRLVHDRV